MNPLKVRVCLTLWIALQFGVLACPAHGQTWTYTGSMNTPRYNATGIRLLDGRVLVTGGTGPSSGEIYDPATGTWTLTSPMVQPQSGAVVVLLNDGRVLLYGGTGPSGVTNLAQVFDPTTGLWTATGSMNQCRQSFTGALLANGQAIAVGGYCSGYLSSAELYNPSTGTWSLTGSLPGPVANASATALPNGKVLVAGGTTGFAVSTAELFDPNSGTWTVTGSLNQARSWTLSTLSGTILLNSGQVLAVGGDGGSGCGGFVSSAELYDPIAGTWAFTGSLSTTLDQHRLTLLSDGRVLASGGVASDCSTYPSMAEIYDPSSGAWSATGSLNQPRAQHAAASLLDGRVLVAGGIFGSTVLNSAEVFSVPCSASTSIAQNFNGTAIPGYSFIWFNSNFKLSNGTPVNGTTVQFAGGTVSFTANNVNYSVAVPNSLITFSSAATCASISFDNTNQQWDVTVPLSGSDEIFLSGLAYPVSPAGLPGGIKNVTWSGKFLSSTPGLSFQWKWGAAVYSSFSTDYNSLGVKPTHQNACAFNNGDHAGTPENFKKSVIGGATGGGGSNFTGSWSGTATVAPVCPAQ
jgi:hypothetical protein